MNVTIAATKSNLLKVKKSFVLTREGHELLDEKRKILMAELSSLLHVVERLQTDADNALHAAYAVVDRALVTMGKKRLEEISFAVNITSDLTVSQRRVMGVHIPLIGLKITDHAPYYSPLGVSISVDEAILKFKDILKIMAQLAEKKMALLRIAKEAQKTIRKVNALEKVYLPYYRDAVKYISDRIDEESRESFSMLKLIKARLKG
ncbi:MAG: V-type ATP synthase subunit D [Candidatus Omnitrophica bacterium]|nr:V-type ATP synthase subunit D [Candidatus Omnitrophota bacterium]